tara:strand:+ start:819 stop:1148 length:330 start_codon:yes stop_codon:yes gene_type:complete
MFDDLYKHLGFAMVAGVQDNINARNNGIRVSQQPWQIQQAYQNAAGCLIQMQLDAQGKGSYQRTQLPALPGLPAQPQVGTPVDVETRFQALETGVADIKADLQQLLAKS